MRRSGHPLARASATLLAALLLSQSVIGRVSAQPAFGSITGRVVACWENFAPVLDDSELLQDVPSPGGGRVPASVSRPVPDVLVALDGTDVTARTDKLGLFALVRVPADQPLVLSVLPDPNSAPVVQADNLVVGAGQSLDIGALIVGDSACGAS